MAVELIGAIAGAGSFVLDVVKCLAAPIGRPFKYLYNYNTNFKNLEKGVRKLKNTREEVQVKVTAAERNVEEIKQNVKDWQTDADSIIDEAEKLIQEKANNPPCFKGLCPNLKTRYKHSKKASKLKRDDISQLLDQEFNEVSYPTIHKEIWLRSNEDYLAFESRNSTVKNVWDSLKDENIYMIGVYGMGGLGKTTLVQDIGRKAEKDKLFGDIVFVEVTETPNTKMIQTAIAKKLGLKFDDEEDESERASKLYSRMKEKDILLIVDNIWEELDLKMIGIPSEAHRGRGKILMTTRNVDVLERMGSTNNFRMYILNEEEAWSLFTKMAGNVIQTRELKSLPKDVCNECGGLPIVICTIAKALKNKSRPSDWKVALREIKAPSPTKFIGLLENEYMKIALSYKYLRDDELKKTFLTCSLIENNTSISDLFKHVVGLDILEGANLTMEDARERLDKLVRELKDSCLLLDCFESGRFAMHDVVRVVALTISYIDHHVFTGRNDVEREWNDKDKLKKCTKISLIGSSTVINQLWPKDLDCPDLEYLYMTNMRDSSYKIPEEFFKVMPKLKVLNLFGMQQLSLPLSLDLLTNLRTLCLDNNKIEDVAIIGNLKKLKVLSLQHSNIDELPSEFGQLTQLQLLNLSNCRRLEVVPLHVIPKLSQLEELYTKGCPIQWKIEVFEELKGLSQLSSLELDIKDNKMLPKDFFSKDLKRYKISIGGWRPQYLRTYEHEILRMLEFKFNFTISLEELRGIKNVELLCLFGPLDDEIDLDDSKFNLQSNEITPVFNEKVIFSNLMGLELQGICSRKIWDNQLPTFMSSSYQNLTHLTLLNCGNIKYAFPFSIAKSLQTLQNLMIMGCTVLEEIVAKEEQANAVVHFIFPHVTLLRLEDLPKLTTFYPEMHTSEWPMLKELVVTNCDKFTSKHMNFQKNNEEGELHISEPKSIFLDDKINSDLEELRLTNKLTSIRWQSRLKTFESVYDWSANITLELLQRFKNLEALKLSCFDQYKEIKCLSDLPNLEVLDVSSCHRLTNLMPSSTSFQSLKGLYVSSCNGLINLITLSTARSLLQLREMRIENCEMVIEIIENEGDATTSIEIVFENLKMLSLKKLESLICFCSGNYSFNFPSLEELNIKECPNMKTFSKGILSTPKLSKINYRWEMTIDKTMNLMWENLMEVENEGNDLNKTIQGAYKKQDISLELELWTFKDINSTKICYNQHPNSFYQNLTHLILSSCENIKYAFPSFIAKSLHQLQHLKIQNCKVLEEIVAKGANEDDNFVFPHVTSLKLEYLPEFIALYHTFEWPMLKELAVKNCDKLMTSKYLSFQENNEEGELHFSEPKSIFLNDKIYPDLEKFELRNDMKEIIWQSQSKAIKIVYDKSANIPLGLLRRFENLKELQLSFCNQYKEMKYLSDVPNLEVLNVSFCDRLMSLVQSSASFQNLKVLNVNDCNGLMMKLITPSMARSLVQLREMDIYGCDMLIEIVENEGDVTITEIVFNNLKKLSLQQLKSLTCFCSGNYSFNFPSLEEFIIKECPNMKTFSQEILSLPKLLKVKYEWKEEDLKNGGSELNTTIQEAHKKKVDSNLKELTLILSGRDIKSIWQGQFQENFGKVKTLQLIDDEYANIPIQILRKFKGLEKLILKVSSYEEIFSFGGDEDRAGALTKLKVLEMWGLFNLKCIWKKDSQLNLILQNLDYLEVQYCHNLKTLLPSSTSFENLTVLKVSYCNGMQNLMSSSTAKSLVRLEYLMIERCEMMVEVLANEGDLEKGEIVFEKLKELYFYCLESLTCFYSGNYTLKFPFLECLDVSECSKMETFSGGDFKHAKVMDLEL